MQSRTVEQVESWDARPYSGGYRELHDLADEDFSGAVVADDVWSFFLNGRVVGVFQGEIDDFASASGTVYEAPHDSLPLLFSMQERGGNTRAKYFTNDTSISEAHETLSEANFTGYLELSENVLSGDYYVSYYGGKSMSTAFVGQSERLLTGEEAFERADDEVGVFEVRTVSMNITEIPEPRDDGEDATEPSTDAPATSAAVAGIEEVEADDHAGDATADREDAADDEGTAEDGAPVADAESRRAEPGADEDPAPDSVESPPESATAGGEDVEAKRSNAREPTGDTNPTGDSSPDAPDTDTGEPSRGSEATASQESSRDAATAGQSSRSAPESTTDEATTAGAEQSTPRAGQSGATEPEARGSGGETADEDRTEGSSMSEHERRVKEWGKKDRDEREEPPAETPFQEEAAWRQKTAIPALDPDESGSSEDEAAAESASARESTTGNTRSPTTPSRSDTRSSDARSASGERQTATNRSRERSPNRQSGDPDRVSELEDALADREDRIEELEGALEDARTEREELEDRVESLKAERDDLEERIASLEADLEEARTEDAGAKRTDLRAEAALAGTNLFVRYDSKGKPTLEGLEDGDVDPEAIDDNLRLEHHTQFEAAETDVEGVPFETFLHDSSRYRFVDWLVRDLPFEVLDSGATTHLKDVYEAIPTFDRIEFDGTVEASTEEGEDRAHDFDVVVRDRMGDPLVVADINESRDPVRDASMDDLVTGASAVSETADSLAGAFYVTASFFEPGALERAQEATDGGGFFSRSEKESYVKVGRKRGYHLCLVEDRGEAFHLTVPEL